MSLSSTTSTSPDCRILVTNDTFYYYLQSKPSSRRWPFRLYLSIAVVCTGPIANMPATHVVHLHPLYLNSLALLTTEDTHDYYDILDLIYLVSVQETAMRMSM
jgi:hypothetical protein